MVLLWTLAPQLRNTKWKILVKEKKDITPLHCTSLVFQLSCLQETLFFFAGTDEARILLQACLERGNEYSFSFSPGIGSQTVELLLRTYKSGHSAGFSMVLWCVHMCVKLCTYPHFACRCRCSRPCRGSNGSSRRQCWTRAWGRVWCRLRSCHWCGLGLVH